jgi:protein-S-isoprenylcysteine O-methyltransferase Ste14
MVMNIQYILSVCAFAAIILLVLSRAALMRKKGIRVLVFGETDKSDFFLLPILAVTIYTVLANAFHLPLWYPMIRPFWASEIPGIAGLILCLLAVAGFALTLYSFGDSFRVGIDEKKPDKLIMSGMFSISRNPIYVCFLLFFVGLFLIHRNITIAAAAFFLFLVIRRQIMREEQFLSSRYGAEYETYCRRVRRYL